MTQLFVSINGLDSNPGDQLRPWRTIQHGVDNWQNGDILNVEPGIFYELVRINKGGELSSPCFLYGQPGAVIDASGFNSDVGIVYTDYYLGASNFLIDNFEIRHGGIKQSCPGVGIWQNSHNITLRNLHVWDTPSSGIFASPSWTTNRGLVTNIKVDNCHIHDTNIRGGQEGISFSVVDYFEIMNSLVHDIKGAEYYPNNKEGIDCKNGCRYGKIHHNEVYKARQGIYIDAYDLDSEDIEIYCNRVHHIEHTALRLAAEKAPSLMTMKKIKIWNNFLYLSGRGFDVFNYPNIIYEVDFFHNTVWGNTNSQIWLSNKEAIIRNSSVRDNILVSNDKYSYLIQYYNNDGGCVIDNNLFYNPHGYDGQPNAFGANPVFADPLLANPEMGDFRISKFSEAVDRGSGILTPVDDFYGNPRPYGTGFDIGANEYTETVVPPPPPPVSTDNVLPVMLGMLALGVIIRSQK